MSLSTGASPPFSLEMAFKEWASVVRALECGAQTVILRRGGIAEQGEGFAAEHRQFWLFPTYFHQQLAGIRSDGRRFFDEAMRDRPPDGRLSITSWAEVKRAYPIEREEELAKLEGRHIYERHVLLDRLHGRHGKSLYVLVVEVRRIEPALDLPMLDVYGGCLSWVALRA